MTHLDQSLEIWASAECIQLPVRQANNSVAIHHGLLHRNPGAAAKTPTMKLPRSSFDGGMRRASGVVHKTIVSPKILLQERIGRWKRSGTTLWRNGNGKDPWNANRSGSLAFWSAHCKKNEKSATKDRNPSTLAISFHNLRNCVVLHH